MLVIRDSYAKTIAYVIIFSIVFYVPYLPDITLLRRRRFVKI